MACRNETLAEDSMARVTRDTLYVAVGKDVNKCRSILSWAIQHSGRDEICILYVHQPAKRLPLLSAKWSAKLLNEKSQSGHRETERQRINEILEKYLTICHENGVQAHCVHTETDNIKRGIVALISQHGIRNLVMGAAADNRYRENMKEPRSRKATYVCIQAPPSCRIQFICKSLLIYTREEVKPPSRTRSVSSTANRKIIEAGPLNLQRSLSVDTLRHNNNNDGGRIMRIPFGEGSEELLSPKSRLVVEGSRCDESCSYGSCRRSFPGSSYSTSPSKELSDVTLNAWTGEDANRNELSVFFPKRPLASSPTLINPSASTISKCSSNGSRSVVDGGLDNTYYPIAEKETHLRLKAERDYFEALNMAQEEGKQRIKIEEALVREREELEQVKNQRDQMIEEVRISEEEKTLLKSQNEELKKKRDELQIELDNALKEAEELRRQVQDSRHMPEFLFSEIDKATEGFHESLRIGQGGYGSVYKGLLPQTEVAIKRLQSNGSQGPSEFRMEVQVLGKLRHPNLIKLIGCCPEQFMLIYEYLPNGSLEDRLKCKDNSPPLSWEARIRIATELCSVLVYLHSRKPHSIVHGDLKPSNVLLDLNFVSKLSDFGICRMLFQDRSSSNNTTVCHITVPKGTFAYIDPEFLQTGELTTKSDVYSFGVILLQLLTGRKPPFKMENDVQAALDNKTLSSLLDPLAGDWPIEIAQNLAYLALMCCDRNRRNRPDLASCVSRELESMKASCVASSSSSSGLQEEISTDGSTMFFSLSRGFEEMAGQ